VDSDGDVSELVPLFISVGVNGMLPFEVQAGMDIRIFRNKYGKNLAIIGGVDKRLLENDGNAIDIEISEKVIPVLKSGGYIPCLDHTVPPNVSLGNFQQFLDLIRKKTGGVYGN
jgi:uroporphyrinogen-III decarboxylase